MKQRLAGPTQCPDAAWLFFVAMKFTVGKRTSPTPAFVKFYRDFTIGSSFSASYAEVQHGREITMKAAAYENEHKMTIASHAKPRSRAPGQDRQPSHFY